MYSTTDLSANPHDVDRTRLSQWSSLSEGLARFGCGAILFIAAVLKAYQLLVLQLPGSSWGPPWLQLFQIDLELLLAAWLFAGYSGVMCRRVLLVVFAAFAGYSAFQARAGTPSCGCFGNLVVAPWQVLLLDLACIAALWWWRPLHARFTHLPRSGLPPTAVSSAIFVVALVVPVTYGVMPRGADGITRTGSIVVLDPQRWIGSRFPLFDEIESGAQFSSGDWTIIFHHHDCSACNEVLRAIDALARPVVGNTETRIACVEVPPLKRDGNESRSACVHARLSDANQWFLATPIAVRLKRGTVVLVRSRDDLLGATDIAAALALDSD